MWTMSEDGEFHLEEPYRTWLEEAKVESTRGWHNALVEYLEQRSPYTAQELSAELQLDESTCVSYWTHSSEMTVIRGLTIRTKSPQYSPLRP